MSFSELNIDIFRMINDLGKDYTALNPIAIFFAKYMLYLLIITLVAYFFSKKKENRMMVIQAFLATALAEVIGKIAGTLYSHHQPFAVLAHVNQLVEHGIDNSFPSDHTTIFFSICVSFWLVHKRQWWLWLILAILVAISRVWVGVHYPVDVAAAALFGIISALIMYWIVPKISFITRILGETDKNKTESY